MSLLQRFNVSKDIYYPYTKEAGEMVRRNVDVMQRSSPIPIAMLINTANSFHCDIFIDCGNSTQVNAKNYDEMKRGLVTQNGSLLFYFNGADENDAQNRIVQIFQP